jgi:hypothetical protein
VSGTIRLPAMKVRAWKLERGTFLVLVFAIGPDDTLTLLAEEEVESEAEVHRVRDEAQANLQEVLQKLGLKAETHSQPARYCARCGRISLSEDGKAGFCIHCRQWTGHA